MTLLTTKPTLNKGLGTFAAVPVDEYTKIIDEAASINLRSHEDLLEAFDQFQRLGVTAQQTVLDLHSPKNQARDDTLKTKLIKRNISDSTLDSMIRVSAVFTANAFKVDDPTEPAGFRRVLFSTISRNNHSCNPNAHCFYEYSSGRMKCHALSNVSLSSDSSPQQTCIDIERR